MTEQDKIAALAAAASNAVFTTVMDAVEKQQLTITDSDSLKYTAVYTGDAWDHEDGALDRRAA